MSARTRRAPRSSSYDSGTLASPQLGSRDIVDADGWHVRVQPCPALDEGEKRRVMKRVYEVLGPFVQSGTVHCDVAIHGDMDQLELMGTALVRELV